MKIRSLIILLISCLMIKCESYESTAQLVVEASITAGKSVDNIRVRLVDDLGLKHAQPVSNADVRLLSHGVTYILNEISDKPGHYAYQSTDLEVISGHEYMLWVQHEEVVAVTSTVVKADSMVRSEIEDGFGYFVAKH